MHRLAALPVLLVLALPGGAADQSGAEARAKGVARFLDEQTFLVGWIDLDRIDVDAWLNRMKTAVKLDENDLAPIRREAGQAREALKREGVHALYVVATTADVGDWPHMVFAVVPLPEEKSKAEDVVLKVIGKAMGGAKTQRVGQALVVAPKQIMRRILALKTAARPELASAFASVDGRAIQIALLKPAHLGRALEETAPQLPPVLGGGSIKTITRGFSWAAAGIDLTPKMSLQLVVQAKDADAARDLNGLLDKGFEAVAVEARRAKMEPTLATLKELLMPRIVKDRLLVTLGDRELVEIGLTTVVKARQAAASAQDVNNLKQIALAMHSYHDVHRTFPPAASSDKQGKSLLSWRVHLLPYIEQQQLYNQFKLDEPWDSEHNKKLIARIPPILRSPGSRAEPGKTTYLVPVGKDTMFSGPKGVRIQDITDGTSNTIMIVEADDDHAVVWTKPDDLKVDMKQPRKGLTGGAHGGFHAAFGDGSVRFIRATINAAVLRALFTRNGGEVLPNDF